MVIPQSCSALQLIQDLDILEGVLRHLSGLLLKLLNGSLANASMFVDQMASGGGLANLCTH